MSLQNYMMIILFLFLSTCTEANVYHNNRTLPLLYPSDTNQLMSIYEMEFIPHGAASNISFAYTIEVPQDKGDDFAQHFYVVSGPVDVRQKMIICSPEEEDGQNVAKGNIEDGELKIEGEYHQLMTSEKDQIYMVYLCANTHHIKSKAEMIWVESEVIFKHAHGYLNYVKYYYLQFLHVLLFCYLITFTAWMIILNKWADYVTLYHKVIGILIFTTMVTHFIQYEYLVQYNNTGAHLSESILSRKIIFIHSIIKSIQEGFVRYIILIVSSGWGMATDKIHNLWKYNILVTLFILLNFSAALHDGLSIYGQFELPTNNLKASTIFIIANGILEAAIGVIALWNFESVTHQLKESNQMQKVKFYDNMMKIFAFVGILLIGTIISTAIFVYNSEFQRLHYGTSWFFLGGSSKMLYFIAIASFAAVFHPNKKMMLYMQSNQLPIHDGMSIDVDDFASIDHSLYVKPNDDNTEEAFGTSAVLEPTFTL